MRFAMTALYFVLGLTLGCPALRPDVAPPTYAPPADGGVDPPEVASTPCGRACSTLRAHRCPEGWATPGGVTCFEVCSTSPMAASAECVASCTSLDQLRLCGVRCIQ